ncbi:MAG: hypothetical protein IKE01_03285 [Clostridia bacterium]|nr:hypothetical protein [Clostridia bacterium]
MRILFAVSNSDNSKNDIVDVILNEYQRLYKKIISYKRAFYYDAIIDEVQQTKNNRYDLIVLSEDLEKSINESYDSEDENLYRHIDEITDEAYKEDGTGIPIILICKDRRNEQDPIISQLFTLGVYNILTGKDRTIQNVCALIDKPRNKKKAKLIYGIDPRGLKYKQKGAQKKISDKELNSIIRFFVTYKDRIDKCVRGFSKLAKEYTEEQIQIIIENLPLDVRIILEENSSEYLKYSKVSVKDAYKPKASSLQEKNLNTEKNNISSGGKVIIPGQVDVRNFFKKKNKD